MNNTIKTKAESLADKMNALTDKFNLSEEMVTTGTELEAYIEEKTQDIILSEDDELTITDVVNLETMVQDFKYVRESLKETTDNGRRVLQSVTLDLLSEDDESRASLITSFAELNRAVADNMKLYMQSYKDISTVILNLDKVRRAAGIAQPSSVTNNNLIVTEQKNTADLIKELSLLKTE